MRGHQAARLIDPVDSTPRSRLEVAASTSEAREGLGPWANRPRATTHNSKLCQDGNVADSSERPDGNVADFSKPCQDGNVAELSDTLASAAKTDTKILMISDDINFSNAARQHVSHTVQFTRTMLLSSDWLERRDEILADISFVLIELPHCRTASGTRNDRKIVQIELSRSLNAVPRCPLRCLHLDVQIPGNLHQYIS